MPPHTYFWDSAGGSTNALTESFKKSVKPCCPNTRRLGGRNNNCKYNNIIVKAGITKGMTTLFEHWRSRSSSLQ